MSVIYNFEDNWSQSMLTVCAANNCGVATAALMWPRCSITATTPRIEFHGMNFARASDQMMYSSTLGRYFYNHYQGEFQAAIFTDRIQSQNHARIVGRVRYLFSIEAQKFVTPAVSYYELMNILETQPEISTVNDDREDVTVLKWLSDFAILAIAITAPPT